MQTAYTRRELLKTIALTPIVSSFPCLVNVAPGQNFSSRRPPQSQRNFTSRAVEETIRTVKAKIADPELAWMFENCYPNTLDTTVRVGTADGSPVTFVITGDIDAMWLRDSSCQVWPYLELARSDADLRQLFRGLIARQVRCILLDPYANAFLQDPKSSKPLSWSVGDLTEMHPGVAERKWEIDSLCYCIRLANGYWRATDDTSSFSAAWGRAMRLAVATLREQQRKHGPGSYHFQRRTEIPTDTQALGGFGNPARPVGLIYSMFRPSDDACIYPLFVPGNLFAMVSLRQLADMASDILHDAEFATECRNFASEIDTALRQYARISDPEHGEIWAYEVDGFGNQLFMDDANTPGLLGLPYLGCCAVDDPTYRGTRARILSDANPYFFKGKAAEGVGGPHVGLDMIWPMSIIMRALTSTDDDEIRQCLKWIKATHAGTGFIHEAFHKDDPARFTRPWFAWANSLFGELIVKLSRECPWILKNG
jgi:meiotically up-regulated gene 157 (Mug157) protein